MELPQVVSVRRFKEFTRSQKDELYSTLLELRETLDELPRKSLRKTLELTLAVLQYKGEQLEEQLQQQHRSGSEDEQPTNRLADENDVLKRMLHQAEEENKLLKERELDLANELMEMKRRIDEYPSDKDSTDPLSELDKQEELLRNIDMKNQHIKKLLREIESLQNQNIEQSKTIITVERELVGAKQHIEHLNGQLATVHGERKSLKQRVNEMSSEITRLESTIQVLEREREKKEESLKKMTERLVGASKELQRKLDHKEREVERLKERLKLSGHGDESENGDPSGQHHNKERHKDNGIGEDTGQSQSKDLHRMQLVLETRDKHIKKLEKKLKEMAAEMITSTQLMNKLTAERQAERNPQNPRPCCELIERSLQKSQQQCRELAEMLTRCEEDNALKAQQALAAANALLAYQRGDDGLKQTLARCAKLEEKLLGRDKRIKELVVEVNATNDVLAENRLLRERLDIPEDMFISSKHAIAKERRKDKMMEHLKMKLRASEEMRLKLKLEKSDLRKEILMLQGRQQPAQEESPLLDETFSFNGGPSEIGEVPDSVTSFAAADGSDCSKVLAQGRNNNVQAIVELQGKYEEIAAENEVLRMGMHEILEKLREYDENSDHITIESEILIRLLVMLEKRRADDSPGEVRSGPHTPEHSLSLASRRVDSDSMRTDDDRSVEEYRDGSQQNVAADLVVPPLPLQPMDSSTRPTTPNRDLDESVVPVIENGTEVARPDPREVQQQLGQLQVYRTRCEELQKMLDDSGAGESGQLAERITGLELKLAHQQNSYAFMREDFDLSLAEAKLREMRHIEEVAELRRSLQQEQQQSKELSSALEASQADSRRYADEEMLGLQKSNTELTAQLAYFVDNVLAGHIDQQYQIKDICADYGVIRDNLQLDYVGAEEYEQHLRALQEATDKAGSMQRKTMQLEGLLEVAQQQIQSQQRLLNDITDNHINLRHLVADLQSHNEEKLLLAKMQRDVDFAQKEISQLRLERDELQHANQMLQLDIASEKQHYSDITKRFQVERSNKDIKIKFLLKSLLMVKEKYCKFTPLIFLTNFVFAYAKFVKASKAAGNTTTTSEDTLREQLMNDLDAVIKGKLQDNNLNESQCLIKLIKVETQCKLLEESNTQLQGKYDVLLQEHNEQRIRFAQEAEHWHTIEALFEANAPESGKKKPDGESAVAAEDSKTEDSKMEDSKTEDSKTDASPKDEKEKAASKNSESLQDSATMVDSAENVRKDSPRSPQRKHASTNTEAPVPAERKAGSPKTPAERQFADKNTSPFPSPAKSSKTGSHEVATQTTSAESQEPNTASPEPAKKKEQTPKSTTEAVVQTVTEPMRSQAVQTSATDTKPQPLERSGEAAAEADSNSRLRQTQEELQTAIERINELEDLLRSKSPKKGAEDCAPEEKSQSGIIEQTILSFHTLLTEKDKSISKFQDLLHEEREHNQTATAILLADIEGLKATVNNLNFTIKTKDMEILELKTKLEVLSLRRNSKEKLDLATHALEAEENVDNSLNELTDEKLEEMFQHDEPPTLATPPRNPRRPGPVAENEEKQDTESSKEMPALMRQLRELKDKAAYWENTLKVKEDEIALLKEKVTLYQEREKSVDSMVNPEIEQFRQLLEEKDRHINDLMETLKSFHDDQQRYIKDSSNYSADQISKLAADLTRTEATNKIYQTQVEALRRQLASLTQREKQARELNQSLRTQLIKRPVVSIKTELNARAKTENLQKRVQQLDLDLEEARAQIQRQQIMLDAKRARSSNEVGMWEKQKRYQQTAEKLRTKLEETEAALEKTRALLQAARTTINRLEKDKHALEAKAGRIPMAHGHPAPQPPPHGHSHMHGHGMPLKCCRAPSCPNLHQAAGGCPDGGKYTQSETPETYTGGSSDCSSPTTSAPGCGSSQAGQFYAHHEHSDLLEALKARNELQQRKILALELAGKGSNALTTELEKLQEKLSACEAQNIRLEAKNLQLQLDNDLLRQGDATDRLEKRIKHLEDYIIALKEEIAQSEARRQLCKCNGIRVNTQLGQSAEQTILSLRAIVEKLKAENKYLKEGRRCPAEAAAHPLGPPPSNCASTKASNELNKLRQMYADSLDKISELKIELQAKTQCPICANRGQQTDSEELQFIRDQLKKKTQLLQKAKVLLTRAAAKEKLLKEQLALWKRKCSELQNVPVIEEISE